MVTLKIQNKCTNGCYQEHRDPSLPTRFSRSLLDKFPSCWYMISITSSNINLSVFTLGEEKG